MWPTHLGIIDVEGARHTLALTGELDLETAPALYLPRRRPVRTKNGSVWSIMIFLWRQAPVAFRSAKERKRFMRAIIFLSASRS